MDEPKQLGSFAIVGRLGAGAMGIVYLAKHQKFGQAAVKVITSEAMTRGNAEPRFEREAEILKGFKHPNIVRWLGHGKQGGTRYIALEYVNGGTLEDRLQQHQYFPWQEAVRLGIQICDALQYAHERGVVHRDLKPSNLMLNDAGQIKLTDFGIAKDLDATALTATGRTLGTAAYMAPEQIRGTPEVSHKTDLYAFGCLFYQLLTGEPPFKGSQVAILMNCHLNEPPPRPSSRNPEIPKALDRLVVELMAKPPTDRPWDAQAVAIRLRELLDRAERGEAVPTAFGAPARGTNTTPAATSPTTTATKSRRKAARTKAEPAAEGSRRLFSWPTVGLAAAGLVVLALIVYVLTPPSAEALYRKAEPLMAAPERSSWILAKTHYLDELNRRYPQHPYQEQVRVWLDKIALDRAEGRARILERPNLFATSRPATGVEELFVETLTKVEKLRSIGLDAQVPAEWQKMAAQVDQTQKQAGDTATSDEERAALRGWLLLAQKRREDAAAELLRRRKKAAELVELADTAAAAGRDEEAVRLRREFLRDFARYPELADLQARARAGLPDEEPAGASDSKEPTRAPADGRPNRPEDRPGA